VEGGGGRGKRGEGGRKRRGEGGRRRAGGRGGSGRRHKEMSASHKATVRGDNKLSIGLSTKYRAPWFLHLMHFLH
jgi:hypothetical protein